MNVLNAKQSLKAHGIHQLYRGESLADALDHITNGTPRKGYKIKHNDGSLMNDNQIIQHENNVAFSKRVSPKVYAPKKEECIEDIPDEHDLREDKNLRGVAANCYYCGTSIRIDSGEIGDKDYEVNEPETHCNDCLTNAISNLVM